MPYKNFLHSQILPRLEARLVCSIAASPLRMKLCKTWKTVNALNSKPLPPPFDQQYAARLPTNSSKESHRSFLF